MSEQAEVEIGLSVRKFYAEKSKSEYYYDGDLCPEEQRGIEGIKTGTVLDICCGGGRGAFPVARRGLKVVGIDFTPSLVDRANAKANEWKLNASFLVGDATHLPFKADAFDAVICLGSLQCLPTQKQRRALLRKATRVLKHGGTFFATTMSLTYPGKYGFRLLAFAALFVVKLPQRAGHRLRGQKQLGLSIGDVISTSDRRSPYLHSFLKRELCSLMEYTGMKYAVQTSDEFLGKHGIKNKLSLALVIVAKKQ